MSLADFATVTITSATRTPTRAGFGTPLVLGYHTAWPDRIRTYQNLTDLTADGITSTGVGAATYWTAAAIFAQNPRVKQIKVGRRTNAWTQVMKLVVTTATAGTVYKFSIGPIGGAATAFQYTVPGASSVAATVTALKALVDAAGLAITTSSVDTNTTLQCTANVAGQMFVYSGRNPELQIFDATAAPAAITTDLDACRVADDDWFGIHLDSSSKAECLLVAPWAETQIKVFFASTSDTENGTVGVASTLLKQLKAAAYTNTSAWVDGAVCPSFLGAGIMGEEFPYDPGTDTGTYHGKTVAGVTVDAPSSTFEGEVAAQNGNTYTTVLGLNVTQNGKTPSGEFIDTVIGKHWLTARLKEAIFGVIAGNRRVPYTNGGIAMLRGTVLGVLKRAQGSKAKPGFLDPEVDPIVTAPLVEEVDPLDRAARIFPDLSFSARMSGAIHKAALTGTISV